MRSVIKALSFQLALLLCASIANAAPLLADVKRSAVARDELIKSFVDAVHSGDIGKAASLYAPAAVAAWGEDKLKTHISTKLAPFFSDYVRTDSSLNTSMMFVQDGRPGMSYHLYAVTESGEKKPFSITVVEEMKEDRYSVGIVVVGKCTEYHSGCKQ
ncbi:MAG: hypothetical protein H6943_02895 [Zoogloeaceae bacterium]|nr:hypothetical protein [Zoogloeaceae bacterium]